MTSRYYVEVGTSKYRKPNENECTTYSTLNESQYNFLDDSIISIVEALKFEEFRCRLDALLDEYLER